MATRASTSRPRLQRNPFDHSIQSFERDAAAVEKQFANASARAAARARKA